MIQKFEQFINEEEKSKSNVIELKNIPELSFLDSVYGIKKAAVFFNGHGGPVLILDYRNFSSEDVQSSDYIHGLSILNDNIHFDVWSNKGNYCKSRSVRYAYGTDDNWSDFTLKNYNYNELVNLVKSFKNKSYSYINEDYKASLSKMHDKLLNISSSSIQKIINDIKTKI